GILAIHSTGSGKTLLAISIIYVALCTAEFGIDRVLVVALPSLLGNMRKEMNKFQLPPWMQDRVYITTPTTFVNDYVNSNARKLTRYPNYATSSPFQFREGRKNYDTIGDLGFNCQRTLL